jgi:predicted  nucleic acid-binding Zn-ribbon protein
MEHNCKTCGWGRQIPNTKTIMMCGCPLCGCYKTDVLDSDGKNCDRWKKATDEYLDSIGMGASPAIVGFAGQGRTSIPAILLNSNINISENKEFLKKMEQEVSNSFKILSKLFNK